MDDIVTTVVTETDSILNESTTAIPKALLEFFIVFGSFYVPCLLGSIISYFIKREKVVKKSTDNHKKPPKINKKKTIATIVISAILPAIVMSALYDVLQQKVNNGVVLMAVAALFGAIGDDLRKIVTFKGIIAIIKVITSGITTISQLEEAITETDETPKESNDSEKSTVNYDVDIQETNNAGISQDSADVGPPDDASGDIDSQ